MANAPHIPVHLGAMQEAVQYQVGMFSCSSFYFTYVFVMYVMETTTQRDSIILGLICTVWDDFRKHLKTFLSSF